jgi:hypothetical protein
MHIVANGLDNRPIHLTDATANLLGEPFDDKSGCLENPLDQPLMSGSSGAEIKLG